jgi:hypothetical protein
MLALLHSLLVDDEAQSSSCHAKSFDDQNSTRENVFNRYNST